jgi:hypothetical protein
MIMIGAQRQLQNEGDRRRPTGKDGSSDGTISISSSAKSRSPQMCVVLLTSTHWHGKRTTPYGVDHVRAM